MDNIYFNCILTKKIIVESKYLNENIDEYIESYLKKKVEGVCIDEGYVKEDSVKVLKKSVGKLLGSRFTGDITYEVVYTANVCNPVIGNIIDCKVKFINKLGILGNNGPITIIIGKQFHSNDDSLNSIGENDIVKAEVIAKKFSLNDKEIKIIAKLWNENEQHEMKKSIKSSDLTPIQLEDQEFDEDEMEVFNEEEEENEKYSVDEEDEYDDANDEDTYVSDEEELINVENPEKTDIEDEIYESDEDDDIDNIEDIELDDD